MKFLALISVAILLIADLLAQDPGMEPIGSLGVELFYATNDDVKLAGDQAQEVAKEQVKALKGIKELSFSDYRRLGADRPTILRGYESWATPLKPSKEILVSFQPIKREGPGRPKQPIDQELTRRLVQIALNDKNFRSAILYLVTYALLLRMPSEALPMCLDVGGSNQAYRSFLTIGECQT